MVDFEVKDITCGHCASLLTKAVKQLDPAARVEVDVAARRMSVASSELDDSEVESAIREAGYTPVKASPAPAKGPEGRKGCCGCCG